LGAEVKASLDALVLLPSGAIKENGVIKTYDDHRMAMAFAPLALKVPVIIEDAEVVSKSYPDFWKDLQRAGFEMTVK
jgi:3-phosphoshikimate 1-carboxyvinyltransferase